MSHIEQWGQRCGVAAIVAASLAGCGTNADVLRSNVKKSSAAAPGREDVHWTSCDPDVLEQSNAQDGDACSFPPGACVTASQCEYEEFSCGAEGALFRSKTSLHDCAEAYPNGDRNAHLAVCSVALDSGSSGDSCIGFDACAKADADPCCVEVARCGSNALQSSDGSKTLMRYRLCSVGCSALGPTPGAAFVSNCSASSKPEDAGSPCEGGFVCQVNTKPEAFLWCSGGVLHYGESEHSLL